MNFNWKRLGLAVVGGAFAGSLGAWSNAEMNGQHIAFTAGNIVIPALSSLLPTILALFAKQPHKD